MKSIVFFGVLLSFAMMNFACNSDPAGVDACRTLESRRCEKLASCPGGLSGGADACKEFYQVQCGRGISPGVQEPSNSQLDGCLKAIEASCEVARTPTLSQVCSFLGSSTMDAATDATDVLVDNGIADMAAIDAATTDSATTDTMMDAALESASK